LLSKTRGASSKRRAKFFLKNLRSRGSSHRAQNGRESLGHCRAVGFRVAS
jgi:hypothetical protein